MGGSMNVCMVYAFMKVYYEYSKVPQKDRSKPLGWTQSKTRLFV